MWCRWHDLCPDPKAQILFQATSCYFCHVCFFIFIFNLLLISELQAISFPMLVTPCALPTLQARHEITRYSGKVTHSSSVTADRNTEGEKRHGFMYKTLLPNNVLFCNLCPFNWRQKKMCAFLNDGTMPTHSKSWRFHSTIKSSDRKAPKPQRWPQTHLPSASLEHNCLHLKCGDVSRGRDVWHLFMRRRLLDLFFPYNVWFIGGKQNYFVHMQRSTLAKTKHGKE